MISKEKFVEIIEKMKEVDNFVEETNDRIRQLDNDILRDFYNINSLVANDEIIIELLDNMFDTDLISYWIYELDYGKEYKKGCIQKSEKGKIVNIDISTPEKLYDFVIKEM